MKAGCVHTGAPILCVLPYAQSDATQAIQLLEWIQDLGGCKHNPVLLVSANNVWPKEKEQIKSLAQACFADVATVSPDRPLRNEKWPRGANLLFQTAAAWVEANIKRPFWWNEPDCIPLVPGWLEYLEFEYYQARRPFLGTVVQSNDKAAKAFGAMVNGGCLYPANTGSRFAAFDPDQETPWDMWMSPRILRDTHDSRLVQHFFGQHGLPPTFRLRHEKGEPVNVFTLEQVRRSAVVFHRNKDGTLIELLRARTPAPDQGVRVLPSRTLPAPKVEKSRTFYHSGNLGDIIYALFAIKKAGGGHLILGPTIRNTFPCENPITKAQYNLLQPLLEQQHYLRSVRYAAQYPQETVTDLNRFRNYWFHRETRRSTKIQNICRMHFYMLGIDKEWREDEPWLTIINPDHSVNVTVNRTARYRNQAFPWLLINQTFKGILTFVGLPAEHQDFEAAFGKIQYRPVKDFLELAQVIEGGNGFIGNQSFACALALGLGQKVIQETCPASPDCVYARPTFISQPTALEPIRQWLMLPRSTPSGARLVISIVCYNRLDLTKRCLEMLFRHTPNFHLIITDNASTDGTGAYLQEFAAKHPNVEVVSNSSNQGFNQPNRTAFAYAMAELEPPEFFCCINNDMEINGPWWEAVEREFRRDPNVALIGATGACNAIEPSFHGARKPGPPEYVEGSLMIVRTEAAKQCGGLFSSKLEFAYGEDSDLSLRLREGGWKILCLDLPVRHLGQQTARSLDLETAARLKIAQANNHQYLRKRWAVYMRRRNFDYQVKIHRLGAMGDVVDLTPAIAALKRKWPQAKLYLQSQFHSVFANNPHVATAARAIGGRFDLSFDLDLCYEKQPRLHHVTAYAQALEVECPLEHAKFEIYPTAQDTCAAAALMPCRQGRKFVAVHMGPTTWPGKDWPIVHWRELTDRLREEGWTVLLVGAGDWDLPGNINLQGKTSLQMLYALFKSCQLFIGVDSGPSHIAQAAEIPTVVLFGTTSPEYILLPRPNVISVQASVNAVPCVGEHHRLAPPVTASFCEGACMRAITPDMVLAAVRSLNL